LPILKYHIIVSRQIQDNWILPKLNRIISRHRTLLVNVSDANLIGEALNVDRMP
jgi:hypothetical protein